MNESLSKELCDKYPSLFSLKDNNREPIGAYGIECDDGWYDILSSICFMVDQHERNIEGNNKYRISQNQNPIDYEPFQFTQIKEKCGGLRVYSNGGDEYTRGLIGMAECWSYKSCEICGNKGQTTKHGWLKTICEKCNNR
jgi:hypothetical protein